SWGIRMRFELLHRCALTLGFAAVGFLFLHPPGVHAQGGEPQYFAIRGAKVVTVSGPPIEGATIVVSRGIITAVARDAAVPPEAWVIEGQGLTVYPGQAAVLDLAGERAGDLVVKSPAAIPLSFQTTGGFGGGFPDSLLGVLAYIHQAWLDTDWSVKAQAIYEKNPRGMARPRYDRTEAALAEALEDHALVLLPANNTVEIRRAFQLIDRWEVKAGIYGGQMGYEVAPEIAAKKLPVLVDLKWPEAEKDGDPEARPSLRALRFRDRAPSTPAALAKAGVKFAFYSGGIAAPKDILKAAKKSIDAGLAPEAALRAFTLSPAEIFGVADRLGSIENGKIANLVVTDGDLFEEKTKIKMVFVDGQRFETHEPEKPKEPPKGDVTGKWKLAYTTPEGAEESTADLVMDKDGAISG